MRYWVISPYDLAYKAIWEKAWAYDLAKGVIAVGWRKLGDISNLNLTEVKELMEKMHPGESKIQLSMIRRFWREIKIGDVVIARRGTRRIAAVGTVTRTAFYDQSMGHERVGATVENYYPNFLAINWWESPRDIEFPKAVFPFATLFEISEDRYSELVKPTAPVPEECGCDILEKYLQDFLVRNFANVFRGKLSIYQDPEGTIGDQYPTGVGVIDILAKEEKTGALVVIELKKGRESDPVVGQALRYMGWVEANLSPDRPVKGMIICNDADDKLRFALRKAKDIELFYYSVSFSLKKAEREN